MKRFKFLRANFLIEFSNSFLYFFLIIILHMSFDIFPLGFLKDFLFTFQCTFFCSVSHRASLLYNGKKQKSILFLKIFKKIFDFCFFHIYIQIFISFKSPSKLYSPSTAGITNVSPIFIFFSKFFDTILPFPLNYNICYKAFCI